MVAANFMWQKWQNLDPPKGPRAPFATFFALRSASICLKDISLLPLFSDYYLTFLYLSLFLSLSLIGSSPSIHFRRRGRGHLLQYNVASSFERKNARERREALCVSTIGLVREHNGLDLNVM